GSALEHDVGDAGGVQCVDDLAQRLGLLATVRAAPQQGRTELPPRRGRPVDADGVGVLPDERREPVILGSLRQTAPVADARRGIREARPALLGQRRARARAQERRQRVIHRSGCRRASRTRALYPFTWAAKNSSVRVQASFAAASSYRGVVSLWKPCCVPG